MSDKLHNQETEVALILCAPNPQEGTRRISSLSEIAGCLLLVREPMTIHDLYLDTGDLALEAKKLALRVREVDERYQVALKGPGEAADWGGEARLEIEAPWSRDALARVIRELADRQIRLAAEGNDFEPTRPLDTLFRVGLEVIQDRITRRQLRNIVSMSRPRGPVLAELAIDHVSYRFGDQRVGLYEVEIEAKREDGSAALRAVTEGLIERFHPILQRWSHSKLATGMAIERLLRDGSLEGMIDAEHDLKPSALNRIDSLLKHDTV